MAPLPFELQVLEIAIKDVCQVANQLTKDLEAVAHPALDALTKSASGLHTLAPFDCSGLARRRQSSTAPL